MLNDSYERVRGSLLSADLDALRTFLGRRGHRRPYADAIRFRALNALYPLTVVHVVKDPPEGWTGERGFITAEVFKRHLPPAYENHEYFICGPGVMMDAIEGALGDELKVPISKYHSERYSFV